MENKVRDNSSHRHPWYAQPVLWLGVAIFVASLAGCLWLILASQGYEDGRIQTGQQVFGVPVEKSVTTTRR